MKSKEQNKDFEKERWDMGYRVPATYFDESEEKILQKIDDMVISENHSDVLGMETPADYFKDSEQKILERIPARTNRFLRMNKRRVFVSLSGVAAVLVVGLFLFKASSGFDTSGNQSEKVTDIFIETQGPYFEDDDLLSLYEDTAMESIFLDDSEADLYLSDYVIENMVIEEVLNE